jgi:hypothetical protein
MILEIESAQGFAPASPGEVLRQVQEAVVSAVEAVLDKGQRGRPG